MRVVTSVPLKFFLSILFISLCSFNSLWAQQTRSIISKFDLYFSINPDTEFWGPYTNDYYCVDAQGRNHTIYTVDTLYAYAEKAISEKLSVPLIPRQVEHPVWKDGSGRIVGFPNNRPKEAAFTQSYDTIIHVRATVTSGGATIRGDVYRECKQKIDMIVEVWVYDKNLNVIAGYKKRTRLDEIKFATSSPTHGFDLALKGNELFDFFVRSLDNAFGNKK